MKLKNIFLLLCPILLQSCITMKPPVFKQADHLMVSNNLNSPDVSFDMVFDNPNNFGLTVKKIETTATVDNGTVLTYKTEQPLRINANSEFTIPVRVTMPLDDLLKTLLRHRPAARQSEITVSAIGHHHVKEVYF